MNLNPLQLSKSQATVAWVLQVIAAAILLQTLFFKFTGAPESKAIFEALGAEPWGRYGSGGIELIASILLLWPGRQFFGAAIAAGVMVGAIFSHLVGPLGIEVQGDGGLLFVLAVVTFVASAVVLYLRRGQLLRFWAKRESKGALGKFAG